LLSFILGVLLFCRVLSLSLSCCRRLLITSLS
jgi:hypothetical protein